MASSGVSEEALAIHREHPAIDLHADTPMWMRWLGYDIHARHEPPLPWAALGGHIDVPRMREGGMAAQFFGLVSIPNLARGRGMARAIHEQIDLVEAALERRRELRVVRGGAELEQAGRDGALGAFFGVEGAHALEGDLENLAVLARRGVRYLGLLHFSANEAGFPAFGRGRDDTMGLTPWGRELVLRCEELGILVDLAHINKRGFLEAASLVSRLPPIVSHTGVLGAFEHWRNIDDDQLRAIAERGGVIGVIFVPKYLGDDGLDAVVKHITHILDVVGEDTPALGSDWDGFIVPTGPLKDPRGLPLLTQALLEAKVHPRVIGKILGGNVRRVIAQLS